MAKSRNLKATTEWQKRRLDAGLCVRCGKPRNKSKWHCDRCLVKQRQYQRRKRGGGSAWRPGGMGRPPLTVDRS